MKLIQLQKKLVQAIIVSIIGILICGGISFYVNMLSEDKAAEIEQMKTSVNAATAAHQMAQKEYDDSIKAEEYYRINDLIQNTKEENFRREYARNLLSLLKEDMLLPDVKFTMTQFEKAKNAELSGEMVAMYISNISIDYMANSDVDALNFIKSAARVFPGNVRITSYTVEKILEINNDMLTQVSRGGEMAPVKGKLTFEWQTIRNNPDYKDPAEAAAAAQNAAGQQPGAAAPGVPPGAPGANRPGGFPRTYPPAGAAQ